MQEIILSIFSFLLLIIIIWFTYTIANIFVTIYRCKKQDHSLAFCFNTTGKVFYSILTILYVVGFIGGIIAMVYGLFNDSMTIYRNGLNVAAFICVVFAYFASTLVMIGRKNMMVGRMMIDYRKLKKVNFTYNNKMSFVYAQKDYSFSTRFVDKTELRKIISK
ncbi:hypothetical protein [Candidatus Stoquefichus massiliensis]|uniref:hypothetical protein n=1 Tax=Candidatus Stoquefichus massiliensis TaxID=1470350 RepID=UPI000480341F|nr:hypothetical protein [Candidatus Stoquefichus massiliensis]